MIVSYQVIAFKKPYNFLFKSECNLKKYSVIDWIKIVTLQGKQRLSKKQISELQFNFQIASISNFIYIFNSHIIIAFINLRVLFFSHFAR